MLKNAALRKLAPPDPGKRMPFTLAGPITYWMVATRELSICSQDLQLAPHVPTVGLELGVQVVVAGYRDPSTGQTVVTRLLLTPDGF
jgi:hypothetical protein